MDHWKHLNIEQRKLISHMLAKHYQLNEMAELIQVDPSSISKEIKRNRILSKKGMLNDKECKYVLRFPYVCNNCTKRYNACPFTQFIYDPKKAQSAANFRLVHTRTGLNMTAEEYQRLDDTVKTGVDNGESIYHIVKSNPELNISVPNVYRLINTRQLTTKRMDLPYAVRYKKRKATKQYEYKENNRIDRTGRKYIDFLAFQHNSPHLFHVQMDFLGSVKTDKKSILTLTIPSLHYVILFLVESPNSKKISDIFNHLEISLTTKTFSRIFPFILTDRDPSFSQFDDLEMSLITDIKRTYLFYCDSFNSSQKANVEQMNKQLRKFFPKGKSIDHFTKEEVKDINLIINKYRIASLAGDSPNDAFIKSFGEKSLDILTDSLI
ncbi:MAG: helix-turn-helix domain-containing protein [Erysipelotrichaceae bacterium]|nr:helix-turn-helix domain-containing protein [Erysipelotrichaceae bacterium]